MGIRSVQIRGFRSIASSGLDKCGPLNILIGKNNAGKSNVLGAIELVLLHLAKGRIAGSWPVDRRIRGEFTDGNELTPLRVGIEFDLPANINEELRLRLTKEAPQLERSIEQIKLHDTLVFILAAALHDDRGCLFVESIAVGKLASRGEDMATDGIRLLSVTRAVGLELYTNLMSARSLGEDIAALKTLATERHFPFDYIIQQPKEQRPAAMTNFLSNRFRPEIFRQLSKRFTSANSREQMETGIDQLVAETRNQMEVIEKSETQGTLSTFAGETKTSPAYAEWLIEQFGKIPFLHFKERKEPIGREEAQTLLRLKTRRGGPDRLEIVQQTIKSLLGVKVDAFEGEDTGGHVAEMDVDDFLIGANGAGIREALRIILDLELKSPKIVLIEEPEVHLHPGLSRVLAGYLREKSEHIQMFVTTHSTDFIDSASFQYVFLVARGPGNRTICQTVEGEEEGALKIPAELGIRLSTVFMFDRLVFVEGPSDESALREFAKKLRLDLAKANIGFVYMEGARNFAYFAAESTLELLSRRQVRMWFVTDKDEITDAEITRMVERLARRAELKVLSKREIENYLLDSRAIVALIEEKQGVGGIKEPKADVEGVQRALNEEAANLRDEVIRLRLERKLLAPVFLRTRANAGTIQERINAAIGSLTQRLKEVETDRASIVANIEESWPANALDDVPGARLLELVFRRFGVRFSKDKGDTERLARYLPVSALDFLIRDLLLEITQEEYPNAAGGE
jgi:putative ATP-dependent endonuclease of OLD family